MHRLNTFLTLHARRPTSHDLRDRLIAQELPEIAEYYLELKRRSERARYRPEVQVTASDVESLLLSEYQFIFEAISARLT